MGKHYCPFEDKEFKKSKKSESSYVNKEKEAIQTIEALGLNKDEMENQGYHYLDAVICTVWINIITLFDARARDEHKRFLVEELEFKNRRPERGYKTRSSGKEFGSKWCFSPRIYATGELFQELSLQKTKKLRKPDDLFHLAFMKNRQACYKNQPPGLQSLCEFIKTKAVVAN